MTSKGDDVSEDIELQRFRFTESFTVEFYVEAENYQKAKDMPQVNYSGSVSNDEIRSNLENMHD